MYLLEHLKIFKKTLSSDKDMEELKSSFILHGNVKLGSHTGKESDNFFKN